MGRRISLRLLFLFAPLALSGATPYGIDIVSITGQQGLASNEVFSVTEDNNRFIWAGTTNGLCRYDGDRFETFKSNYNNPAFFINNTIRTISRDDKDRLWLITSAGLEVMDLKYNCVDKYGFTPFPGAAKIYDICVTHNGRIFIAVDRSIYEYTGEDFRRIDCGDCGSDIRVLYEDSRGRLWAGTVEEGFFSLDTTTDEVFRYPAFSDIVRKPTCFQEDNAGGLWIGTWREGLFRLDYNNGVLGRSYEVWFNDQSLGSIITGIAQDDRGGYIWAATYDGVKVITDPRGAGEVLCFNRNSHPGVFVSNEVRDIYSDSNGCIWMATMGGGLMKAVVYPRYFSLLQPSEMNHDIHNNEVHAVHLSSDNTLWTGIRMDLFAYRTPDGRLVSHNAPAALRKRIEGQTVCDICELADGRLWITTRYWGAIVARYAEGRIRSAHYINRHTCRELASDHFFLAREDDAGNIWVGTQHGLEVFRPEDTGFRIVTTTAIREVTSDVVQALHIDTGGSIWMGTEKSGAVRLDYDEQSLDICAVKRYTVENGRSPGNDIQCFCRDARGYLWMGSQGGAFSSYRTAEDRFAIIEPISSLYADTVFSIIEDAIGNLWLGTDKGLVRYSAEAAENQVVVFNSKFDTQGALFTRGAACRTPDGRMLFGSNLGLMWFDPTQISVDYTPPGIIVTDILINGKSISAYSKNDKERPTASYLDELKLGYREQNISILFSDLSFDDSGTERYAYSMEGLDTKWNYTKGSESMVTYNLRKGNYTFRVNTAGGNGVWSMVPATLRITVDPAPWDTWWAYAFYALIVFSAVLYYARNFKKRTQLAHDLMIQQLEHRKSEEVNQAKLVFFTNISHEIFTPLTILSCSLDELREREMLPAQRSVFETMKANVGRLLRLTLQILEFRKAESGNLVLKVSQGNLTEFVRNLCEENFSLLAEHRHITLRFHGDTPVKGCFDTDKIDKIVYNLLSNAIKYNYEGGSVEMTVSETEGWARITVTDTGCGIPEERLDSLFTRFYEGDYRKFNTHGTGIGLSLVRDLVELHNGSISVESSVGHGTTFTVSIPLDRTNYHEVQLSDTGDADSETEGIPIAAPSEDGERPSILIVEDSNDMREMLKSYFEHSFSVTTAINGKEALRLTHKKGFDMILTDYAMPVMDGVELCKAIKSDLSTSHIPVVLLTARRTTEDKLTGFGAGADMYITKPFNIAELLASVTALNNNRRRIAESFRRHIGETSETEFTFTALDQSFLRRTADIVLNNVGNSEFSTEKFSRELNISQATLYRKLKTLTGLSANEFIRNIRMKRACELLLEYDKNISEVAYAVGYNNPQHFSSSFKKEIGLTPREWINSRQRK